MTEQVRTLTTLTRDMSIDGVEDVVEMEIQVVGDDEPPEALASVVHAALRETIGHLVDGNEFRWENVDGMWRFTFLQGVPELPHMTESGGFTALAPYRTAEKFEGVDGDENGLFHVLPDGWEYEKERQGVYDFYEQ